MSIKDEKQTSTTNQSWLRSISRVCFAISLIRIYIPVSERNVLKFFVVCFKWTFLIHTFFGFMEFESDPKKMNWYIIDSWTWSCSLLVGLRNESINAMSWLYCESLLVIIQRYLMIHLFIQLQGIFAQWFDKYLKDNLYLSIHILFT